MYTQTNTLTDS